MYHSKAAWLVSNTFTLNLNKAHFLLIAFFAKLSPSVSLALCKNDSCISMVGDIAVHFFFIVKPAKENTHSNDAEKACILR